MTKNKKEDVKNEWRQIDVDLMLWNYCVGLIETTNKFGIGQMTCSHFNALINARIVFLDHTFKVAPSFRVTVRQDEEKKFHLEKIKP